jgi:hypothetical protein
VTAVVPTVFHKGFSLISRVVRPRALAMARFSWMDGGQHSAHVFGLLVLGDRLDGVVHVLIEVALDFLHGELPLLPVVKLVCLCYVWLSMGTSVSR